MNYIKYFEGVEDTQMGISSDEIRECFYDLSDEKEWTIIIRFAKKLYNTKVNKEKGEVSMYLLPYLEIKIYKMLPEKSSVVEMQELKESELFKGCLESLLGRLNEHNLFIRNNQVERMVSGGSQIFILIYRKSDENYVSRTHDFKLIR